MTLDFLVGPDGLRWIDAAVVGSDESFEEIEERARGAVAARVLGVLGVSIASVTIDARVSSRYHEAGFLVSFAKPRPGSTTELRIDTADLQRVATAAGSRVLKVSVCGAGSVPESEVPDVFEDRVIRATRPGTLPATINDRQGCHTWTTRASDQAVRITIAASELPRTGASSRPAIVLALGAVAAGIALTCFSARLRREE